MSITSLVSGARTAGLALASLVASACLTPATVLAQAPSEWLAPYREPASRLIDAAVADQAAWSRLAVLTDTFGHRLSGSPGLDGAIAWAVAEMKKDGLDNVRAEPAMVPRWIRGRESVEILEPVVRPLAMLGLGGSIGTSHDGIVADAVVVSSFDDLEARAKDVAGRIVVYNVPFTDYGQTVQYRAHGATRAAKLGALAAIVRSVGPMGLRTPHTGSFPYEAGVTRIPAAAIAAEDAEQLQRMQDRGERIRLKLTMEAQTLADAPSANVVGEIVGRERPGETVVVGCHFDSWDVGTGAVDDGGGCVAAWEAVRLLKQLGLRPRRTLRVVLFTNEENGLRGGLAYRDQHRDDLANHVMMLEADLGFFPPLAFGFSGNDRARAAVTQIAALLEGIGVSEVRASGGGADIGPSVQAASIPAMSFNGDAKPYFLIHHTPADTIDRVDPKDLARAVAAMSVMAYVVADMPERLGAPEPTSR
jgi:carboxypeptidase Q